MTRSSERSGSKTGSSREPEKVSSLSILSRHARLGLASASALTRLHAEQHLRENPGTDGAFPNFRSGKTETVPSAPSLFPERTPRDKGGPKGNFPEVLLKLAGGVVTPQPAWNRVPPVRERGSWRHRQVVIRL